MNRLQTARRPATFVGVGLLSAAVDAGVFSALFALGVPPALASAGGFCTAFWVNYSGNRVLVFRAKRSKRALRRYVLLVLVNLALTTGIVGALSGAGLEPHLAKGISMVLIAAFNYVAMRRWVFPDPAAATA